jgi:hypothetical protein
MTAMVHSKEMPSLAFAQTIDAPALFCWTFKDALIAALDREIDAAADDQNALASEARERAEAELSGDLLDVERQEAALTWRAQAEGLLVEHRPDCAPQAILALQLVTRVQLVSPPATSQDLMVEIVEPR